MLVDFGESDPHHWFWERLVRAGANVRVNGQDLVCSAYGRDILGRRAVTFHEYVEEAPNGRGERVVVMALDDIATVKIW